jgi:hypothetical protein
MYNLPPPEPPPEPSNQREPLGFDDFIGILVAFASIGGIIWWSFSQGDQKLDLPLSSSSSPSPTALFFPEAKTRQEVSSTTERLPTNPLPVTPQTPVTNVPVAPIPSATTTQGLGDVPENYWARPFIAVMVSRNIMPDFPDGNWRPEQLVNRAEFAQMLQKAFQQAKTRDPVPFKDLKASDRANPAIEAAVTMEFMKGYPGQVFRPEQPLTKVEALVALSNGLRLPVQPSPEQVLRLYQDADSIPKYAIERVAKATTTNLVVNHPDRQLLTPQKMLTRAESAALIYQALVSVGAAEKITSPYIVQP